MRTKRIVLSSGALVGAALAIIAVYSSCSSTGGGNDPIAAGSQFVSQSCGPAGPFGGGPCLSLTTPNSVPADGQTIAGFRARLVDGSGAPLPGIQICFAFENPGVATIIEPTNACGLTDQNGVISGQFRAGSNPGSFALVATPQAGFALQIRRTIKFGGVSRPGGGAGCTTAADCEGGECSSNPAICGAGFGSCCLDAPGEPCTQDSECAGGLECLGGTCREAEAGAIGDVCVSAQDCASGFCGGAGPVCLSGPGDPCTVSSDCGGGGVCTAGNCTEAPEPTPVPAPTAVPPGGVGDQCTSTAQCLGGLVCSPTSGLCAAKVPSTQPCTIDDECISGTCQADATCA